jgi:hypothetical protein
MNLTYSPKFLHSSYFLPLRSKYSLQHCVLKTQNKEFQAEFIKHLILQCYKSHVISYVGNIYL